MGNLIPLTWKPKTIEAILDTLKTSTRVAKVTTDAGIGYLKTVDNKEGPFVIAADWIGTRIAGCLGIPSLIPAIIEIDEIDAESLSERTNLVVKPGPAYITKGELADTYDDEIALDSIVNISDIPKMVILDTWIRNVDKYTDNESGPGRLRVNRDNLILSAAGAPKGKWILKPIDFGLAFDGPNMSAKLNNIDRTKDTTIYGCFPEFRHKFNETEIAAAFQAMETVESMEMDTIIGEVPVSWFGGNRSLRHVVKGFLSDRREFLLSDGREKIRALLKTPEQTSLSLD